MNVREKISSWEFKNQEIFYLVPKSTEGDLEKAMEGRIIAWSELIGVCKRKWALIPKNA